MSFLFWSYSDPTQTLSTVNLCINPSKSNCCGTNLFVQCCYCKITSIIC